jgi:hypothetical protein
VEKSNSSQKHESIPYGRNLEKVQNYKSNQLLIYGEAVIPISTMLILLYLRCISSEQLQTYATVSKSGT